MRGDVLGYLGGLIETAFTIARPMQRHRDEQFRQSATRTLCHDLACQQFSEHARIDTLAAILERLHQLINRELVPQRGDHGAQLTGAPPTGLAPGQRRRAIGTQIEPRCVAARPAQAAAGRQQFNCKPA